MARVYLETSFISYLTAVPRESRDPIAAAHQQITIEWGVLPQKAFPDALHIAIATVHQVEYLLTWNCKHIANVEVLPRIAGLCEGLGLVLPMICTPEELLGVEDDH